MSFNMAFLNKKQSGVVAGFMDLADLVLNDNSKINGFIVNPGKEEVLFREDMLTTIVEELKDISRSYKEAKMALDIGKIFYSERNIVAYNKLGLGRLIYQLPVQMCRMFIHEIFGGKTPDDFDEETLQTINKFFENSLNVSETSRQLFIHRNTLVYRLDKILKLTNLDLRVFDDAITFKMAMMVVKYMKYMETMDY